MTTRSTVTALLRLANATHGPTSVHELGESMEPPGDATSRWEPAVGPLLERYRFRLELDGRLVPTASGWDGFIAERLRELVLLRSDPRGLRLCQAETCRWLFLDDTRNQRRRWCDMATCGSRAKMRTYRARRSGSPPSSDPTADAGKASTDRKETRP